MKLQSDFIEDTRGDAVVEATILFPIIMMIFAGLMLLAVYLPVRMTLQHNTQVLCLLLNPACHQFSESARRGTLRQEEPAELQWSTPVHSGMQY